jgi:hypothetical protein
MDFLKYYKEKEINKILNEVSEKSAYQKDLTNYYNIGCAEGFVNCLRYIEKDKREKIIQSMKEFYQENKDKKDMTELEYILRIYNDEYKAIEI